MKALRPSRSGRDRKSHLPADAERLVAQVDAQHRRLHDAIALLLTAAGLIGGIWLVFARALGVVLPRAILARAMPLRARERFAICPGSCR